ncbi:MAG: hypothetical protein IPM69_14445 [Ignavibacteria bacterium]|nr:hypothetical protein [Ignavibacteria bacterium]
MIRQLPLNPHIFIALLILILVGCQSSVRFTSSTVGKSKGSATQSYNLSEHSITPFQHKIISSAEKFLGVPYCYGGKST